MKRRSTVVVAAMPAKRAGSEPAEKGRALGAPRAGRVALAVARPQHQREEDRARGRLRDDGRARGARDAPPWKAAVAEDPEPVENGVQEEDADVHEEDDACPP